MFICLLIYLITFSPHHHLLVVQGSALWTGWWLVMNVDTLSFSRVVCKKKYLWINDFVFNLQTNTWPVSPHFLYYFIVKKIKMKYTFYTRCFVMYLNSSANSSMCVCVNMHVNNHAHIISVPDLHIAYDRILSPNFIINNSKQLIKENTKIIRQR